MTTAILRGHKLLRSLFELEWLKNCELFKAVNRFAPESQYDPGGAIRTVRPKEVPGFDGDDAVFRLAP